ncbi:50S ribosomal protein L9 [Kiloniella laminariae]|uniref:50S ribosomal protein L9 n=1 Tax=Kiloniella laminariae TaxID=454162 RepID=UPI00037612F7
MQVVLLERIEKLGQMGDVVSVKPGYARNFLLPKRKAMRATKSNLAQFEAQRAQLEATNLQLRDEAQQVAGKLEGLVVSLIRQAGDSGQLYGSVNTRDISDAVAEAGITINRSQVVLDKVIKTLGLHDVKVVLHPEVSVGIVVNAARSLEEAKLQVKTDAPVSSRDAEAAEAEAEVEEVLETESESEE